MGTGLDVPEVASREEGAFSPIGFWLLSDGGEARVRSSVGKELGRVRDSCGVVYIQCPVGSAGPCV